MKRKKIILLDILLSVFLFLPLSAQAQTTGETDSVMQEHELREKAETILCGERRKALAFSAEMARQERTIDDLRQQISFMRQAMQDEGA